MKTGRAALSNFLSGNRGPIMSVMFFSLFVNVLLLTGPIFMLQVYNRVLSSGSTETLLVLFLLVTFMFTCMGVLDFVRGQILMRLALRFQAWLDPQVFKAMVARNALTGSSDNSTENWQDIDLIRQVMGSSAVPALIDLIWVPVFLLGMFLVHPWLGGLALSGAALLIIGAAANRIVTWHLATTQTETARHASTFVTQACNHSGFIVSSGLQNVSLNQWRQVRDQGRSVNLTLTGRTEAYRVFSRTFRLFLQSAMLGLGALLVLKGELSAGAMIATSILLGRALAPVDIVISHWQLLNRATMAWNNLQQLLALPLKCPPGAVLSGPVTNLQFEQATVVPPGTHQATLRFISFQVNSGVILGITGPSGAGKTTLARVLTGAWPSAAGVVRIGGTSVTQFTAEQLGELVGYLPQDIPIFQGTVAENIANFHPTPDADTLQEAAKSAGAHDIIQALPLGYSTPLGRGGSRLSSGHIQRIGLARAIYGDPAVVILDEPDSCLDTEGYLGLQRLLGQLRSSGKIVLLISHRPQTLMDCDQILALENGKQRAFGNRSEIYPRVGRSRRPKSPESAA